MKKADLKKIRGAAATLPVIYEPQKVPVWGEDILKENPAAVDAKGKPIGKDKIYIHTEPRPVNHESRMKDVFNRAPQGRGHEAVYEYCQAVIQLAERRDKATEEKLNKMSV